jgi:excinuclease UvrABC ATPase subunit
MIDDKLFSIGEDTKVNIKNNSKFYIVIDRFAGDDLNNDENLKRRVKDSLELAYKTGKNLLEIYNLESNRFEIFSKEASCPKCHYILKDLTISNFSFNSHF